LTDILLGDKLLYKSEQSPPPVRHVVLPNKKSDRLTFGIKPRGGGTKEKLILTAGRKPPLPAGRPERSASFFRSGEMAEKSKAVQKNKNSTGTHTQISIRLPNILLDRIESFATADRRSRNNAVEHLLWQVVKEKR
jgi:hypothetical protein